MTARIKNIFAGVCLAIFNNMAKRAAGRFSPLLSIFLELARSALLKLASTQQRFTAEGDA